jgi:hypothetical protein
MPAPIVPSFYAPVAPRVVGAFPVDNRAPFGANLLPVPIEVANITAALVQLG